MPVEQLYVIMLYRDRVKQIESVPWHIRISDNKSSYELRSRYCLIPKAAMVVSIAPRASQHGLHHLLSKTKAYLISPPVLLSAPRVKM